MRIHNLAANGIHIKELFLKFRNSWVFIYSLVTLERRRMCREESLELGSIIWLKYFQIVRLRFLNIVFRHVVIVRMVWLMMPLILHVVRNVVCY